jgi:hypothetical protein
MRMRGAQHRGMQRARTHAEIVDEAASAGQQRGIFHALDRTSHPSGCRGAHVGTLFTRSRFAPVALGVNPRLFLERREAGW